MRPLNFDEIEMVSGGDGNLAPIIGGAMPEIVVTGFLGGNFSGFNFSGIPFGSIQPSISFNFSWDGLLAALGSLAGPEGGIAGFLVGTAIENSNQLIPPGPTFAQMNGYSYVTGVRSSLP